MKPPNPDFYSIQIEQWLSILSPAEKVGQLFVAYFDGSVVTDKVRSLVQDCHLGGVILYQKTGNLESLTQIAHLTQSLQSLAQIPLFISIDQEGGSVTRLPPEATSFPSMMAVAATGSLDYAYQVGAITAQELYALGINVNYAPVLDVHTNPTNPIIGTRSFSSDPNVVTRFAQAVAAGHRRWNVIPTFKHFPGHGDTDLDSHHQLPTLRHPLDRLKAIEIFPFQQVVAQGAEMIMTAHIQIPALAPEPATLSPRILQEILRQELGFQGVIITDSLTMGALSDQGSHKIALQALQAGADLLLFGADIGHTPDESRLAYHFILENVEKGVVSLERVEESVRRILTLKLQYAFWDPPQPQASLQDIGSASHRQIAQEIATASVQIQKDDLNLLPISLQEKVAVIWSRGSLGSVLAENHPQVTQLPISLDPTETEKIHVQKEVTKADKILFASFNALAHPNQLSLIQSLPQQHLIWVALGSPEDHSGHPEAPCYITTYGEGAVSLKALMQKIFTECPRKGL
jgi:beta-N-acetylhexosaminidase